MPAVLILAFAGRDSLFADLYRFFTTAALVTFGGAYAVLAWVSQQVVEVHGWLTQAETVAGLALAETTPGPLIIVLQFIGFMAGWNHAAGVDAPATATVAALLTSWATFLPSFVFILVGAPYVERLSANHRLAGALAGVTAAVVGVIGSLAIAFGRGVLFPDGFEAPAWGAIIDRGGRAHRARTQPRGRAVGDRRRGARGSRARRGLRRRAVLASRA